MLCFISKVNSKKPFNFLCNEYYFKNDVVWNTKIGSQVFMFGNVSKDTPDDERSISRNVAKM